MEKQKKQIAKFEVERVQYKARIKELTDEMAMMMHGRELQGSDEDSPDQLSEIDKQQELMANISMKNKHIKRLLRDIEVSFIRKSSNFEYSVTPSDLYLGHLFFWLFWVEEKYFCTWKVPLNSPFLKFELFWWVFTVTILTWQPKILPKVVNSKGDDSKK